MYHIDIMTLFPDTVGDVLSESILGRAQERDYIRILTHQIRDYTRSKQKQVDDYPYGGGQGAVIQADPLYQCQSVESGARSWKWIRGDMAASMHQMKDILTIAFQPAVGELH